MEFGRYYLLRESEIVMETGEQIGIGLANVKIVV